MGTYSKRQNPPSHLSEVTLTMRLLTFLFITTAVLAVTDCYDRDREGPPDRRDGYWYHGYWYEYDETGGLSGLWWIFPVLLIFGGCVGCCIFRQNCKDICNSCGETEGWLERSFRDTFCCDGVTVREQYKPPQCV